MTIQFAYGEAVVRLVWSAGPKNQYNQPTNVYTPETIENVGVDVPDQSNGAGDQEAVDAMIFLPAGTTTSKQDMFVIRGLKYKAETDGLVVRNPFTGAAFPTPVAVRRVVG